MNNARGGLLRQKPNPPWFTVGYVYHNLTFLLPKPLCLLILYEAPLSFISSRETSLDPCVYVCLQHPIHSPAVELAVLY